MKTNLKHFIGLTAMIGSLLAGCASGLKPVDPPSVLTASRAEFMLSFDDGPMPGSTERVLDMLAAINAIDGTPVKAGFFLLADAPDEFWLQRLYYAPFELWTDKGSIAKYPKIARRIQQDGHAIGSHTTHHAWINWPWLDTPQAAQDEFTEWEAISKPVLGESNSRLFRPPYLNLSVNLRETAKRLGYTIVMGETVGDAIPGISVDEIKQKTQTMLADWNQPKPCLLIFHDNRPATFQNLSEIIGNLQQQGFRLVHFDAERL